MWIEERRNSKGIRYVYGERYTDPVTGHSVKVSVTLNSNSAHAQKQASLLLWNKFQDKYNAPDKEIPTTASSMTVAEVSEEWLDYTRPMIKPSSAAVHSVRVKKFLSCLPVGLSVRDLSRGHIDAVARSMHYEQGLTYSYTNTVITICKSIARYAVDHGYIDANKAAPILSYKLKPRPLTASEIDKRREKFLDRDELKEVLGQLYALSPRISEAMEFIALTGLRCGELLALRVQDYNPDRKEISVNGTISTVHGVPHRGTPKNVSSYRTVSLNNRADSIIRRAILSNKQRSAWSPAYHDRGGYIFTGNTGRPLKINAINAILNKIQVPSGKHISTHVFRHTHISILVEIGLPLKAIMQRVGHSRPETTLAIYTHVTSSMDRELQDKLNNLKL